MVGRRRDDQELAAAADGAPSFWKNSPARLETIGAIIAALIAVVGWLGLHISTPLEARVRNLEERQNMDSYLLCVLVRRNDPTSLPPECAPVEAAYQQRGGHLPASPER